MADQWERVHTNKGWHIRFRADNSEPVVHGEVLTSKQDCDTAIISVARAHSPVYRASIGASDGVAPDGKVYVRVWSNYDAAEYKSGSAVLIPVVDVDERRPSRRERIVGALARGVTGG